MDEERLARLRERFGGARETRINDPVLRRELFALARSRRDRTPGWSFTGLPTFLDAAYDPALSALDLALVGIPTDLGVTNRPGARLGPRAVREIERIGPYHHTHRFSPETRLRIADVGDVPFRAPGDADACRADIEAFIRRVVTAGARPVCVGGDHSVSFPILKALTDAGPLALVHIDAHCDTAGPVAGMRHHHGSTFRDAVLAGLVDPQRTIQIGIRGPSELLWEFSSASGMTVVHMEEAAELGPQALAERVRSVVGGGPAYLSFDIDSLDPAFAPGTGTPEAGGFSTREVQGLLRALVDVDFVGADVVEVSPNLEAGSLTAMNAAQILFEIVCLMAANSSLAKPST